MLTLTAIWLVMVAVAVNMILVPAALKHLPQNLPISNVTSARLFFTKDLYAHHIIFSFTY